MSITMKYTPDTPQTSVVARVFSRFARALEEPTREERRGRTPAPPIRSLAAADVRVLSASTFCGMDPFEQDALRLLRQLTGIPDATFRDGQLEAIRTVVAGHGRALVVQRTGWGKSAVYLIATSMLRAGGSGPTVIVSPLLALMRNQVEMADALGVDARTVNSANRDDWDPIFAAIDDGEVDLLLISPERLNNPKFRSDVMPSLLPTIGLLVIDEVHCISDWGHDFRPDYRRLGQLVGDLDPGVPILGTTATANDRVVADVVAQLGDDLQIFRGTLERDSLALQVLRMPDRAERMAWLAEQIPRMEGSGIVYCLTIADAERVGVWLRSRGIEAATYTGPTPVDERLEIERRLSAGDLKVVVATSALAMGYDNPHIEFVIHYQTPGSPIAYYQQVGRAGRAVDRAFGVAMIGGEDRDIQDWFIDQAFPTVEQTDEVLSTLAAADGLSRIELERTVNIRRSRIEAMLKILEVEGAVERRGSKWFRSPSPWEYPAERIAGITANRRLEQAAMQTYATTDGCLMEFLRRELDDPGAAPCGRCANCVGELLPTTVDPTLVQAALEQVRRTTITIGPPRVQAPCGLSSRLNLKEFNVEPGRSLTRRGDPGWARLVDDALDSGDPFADELVDAMVTMIRAWRFPENPTWMTTVPSTTRGPALSDFADRPPQSTRENPCQLARNVIDAFVVRRVRSGAVLLLDDLVDSRWTLTVVGHDLRVAGSGPVYPVTLTTTSGA